MSFVCGNGSVPGCKCGIECEMPCWQRVGLTTQPCCPDCPPLPIFVEEDDDGE